MALFPKVRGRQIPNGHGRPVPAPYRMSQRRLGGRTHAEGLRRYARQQLPVVDTSLLAFAVDLCPKMATSPGFRVSAPEPVRTKKEMFLVVKIRVWHNSVDELRCGRGSAIAKKRYTVSSTSSLSVDRHFASDFRGYSTSHRAADRGIYGLSPVSRSSRAHRQGIVFRSHAGGLTTATIVAAGNRGTIFCQASTGLTEWLFKPN